MKILVVGKGGREHALAKAAHASKLCDQLYCAPGNPGMAKIATCLNVSDSDIEGLVKAAKENEIDLTIVGPEATLSLGIVDAFEKEGLKIFGPTKAATQVESSKDFAKQIMAKYDIPTAAYQTFDNYDAAWKYVESNGAPIVIKEDGLKAGKGVTVAMDLDQANEALKIAFDIENVIKTIEFNARFGDPEAEVILPRLESDFVQAILDVMDNKPVKLKWSDKVSHGVVLASEGYPAGSTSGAIIEGVDDVDGSVYHMGTKEVDGNLVTAGGRVLMVVTLEPTLEEAFEHTYNEIKKIHCDKLFFRTDIGRKDMD